jgi:hypothetical protein
MTADLLERLSRDGPAWLLLVVAIGAITYLYKGRIADWKEIAGTLKEFSGTIRDWIAANEPRTRALEANVKALESVAIQLGALTSAIDRLNDVVSDRTSEALKSNRELREVILTLKEQILAIYNRCLRAPS